MPPDGKIYKAHLTECAGWTYFHQECLEERREAFLKMQREEDEKTYAPNPSRYDSSSNQKN